MAGFMLFFLSSLLCSASAYYTDTQGSDDYTTSSSSDDTDYDHTTSNYDDYTDNYDTGDYDTTTSNYVDHGNNTSDYVPATTASTSNVVSTTTSGLVTCDSAALQVCSSNSNTCQQLLLQGSCENGHWLVATGRNWQHGEVTCAKRNCTTGMYFYPTERTCVRPEKITCGDNEVPALTTRGTIGCHCKVGTVPFDNKCYKPYTKGPCGDENNYLVVTKYNVVKCLRNGCGEGKYNWVKFKHTCRQLNMRGPCKEGETLQANPATSFIPACLSAKISKAVTDTPTVCSNGVYTDQNGNCKQGFSIIYISTYFRTTPTVKNGRCGVESATKGSRPDPGGRDDRGQHAGHHSGTHAGQNHNGMLHGR